MPSLRLGCPVWACDDWRGTLFTERAARREFLDQYSRAFGTVEGNSVFYGLPTLDTASRWAAETADGFHFALKFPRTISHDGPLGKPASDTRAFLEVLDVLHEAERLGPSFLQLPPYFDGSRFDELANYLEALPTDLPFAVEVRHADWFDEGPRERAFHDLLGSHDIDRVTFDSRALFSAEPSDPFEAKSQDRKPLVPIRHTVTGRHPFLRFVGRNDVSAVQPWIDEWAPIVAEWLAMGLEPYVFTHAPNDRFAPEFARLFHETLTRSVDDLTPLPPWPGELEPRPPVQRSLF